MGSGDGGHWKGRMTKKVETLGGREKVLEFYISISTRRRRSVVPKTSRSIRRAELRASSGSFLPKVPMRSVMKAGSANGLESSMTY